MKKTRNMIILVGDDEIIRKVLPELQFKGSITINEPLSNYLASDIFANNKSIICNSKTAGNEYFHENPLLVQVSEGPPFTFTNYIDVKLGNIAEQLQNILSKNNLDIGDHKSNSSGMNGVPSISECSYCKILNHLPSEFNQKILYESKYFFVMVTAGQFITGYLLIIPKRHVMSMAELTEDERDDFLNVLDDVKLLLSLTYGYEKFLVWENGTGNSGKGKAKDSIVHCHVHIAPSKQTATKIVKMSGIQLNKISYSELPNYNLHSYLLIAGKDYTEWFINNNPDVYIPRQFIRQILGDEYKISGETWNWRLYPFVDLMRKTEKDILSTIKNNWSILPNDIKKCTRDHIQL